ncbi:unnamed protein product, partial [Mesorhabditis spiculigera]
MPVKILALLFALVPLIHSVADPVPDELQCDVRWPACVEGYYCNPVWVCSSRWCPTAGKCTPIRQDATKCDLHVKKNPCGRYQFCAKLSNETEGRCAEYFPSLHELTKDNKQLGAWQ